MKIASFQTCKQERVHVSRGPFKYYVIKQVGGWGGQMIMFDDKVGGWLNADVIKKYTRKNLCLSAQEKTLFECAEKKGQNFLKKTFFLEK